MLNRVILFLSLIALPAGAAPLAGPSRNHAPVPAHLVFAPNYAGELGSIHRWTHFPLRIYFPRGGSYTLERQHAATAGFDHWVQASSSIIRYQVVENVSGADIIVRFDPTQSSGLTQTQFSGVRLVHASINLGLMDPLDRGMLMPLADLQCVAAHEFGHALGLNGHSSNPNDVMYYRHTIGWPWSITERDLNTLRTDYYTLFAAS